MNQKPIVPPDEREIYSRFFTEVGIINQLVSTRAERNLPYGLTLSQFSVLNHFSRGLPPKSPLALANAFQVTKGAMTNTLKQLERKGFVDIQPDEKDGRAKIVSPTQAGLSAHGDASLVLASAFKDFSESIAPDEIKALLPGLERIRIWLDNNR